MTVSDELRVRRAVETDVRPWLALFDEAVSWLVASGREGQWGAEPLSSRPDFPQRVQRWVDSGDGRVAVLDGEVVGALALGAAAAYAPPPSVAELYVEGLVVSRRRSGVGIGAALMQAAVNEARQRGVKQVRLDCWAGGDGALVRYYERLGFQRGDPLQVGAWSGQLMSYAL